MIVMKFGGTSVGSAEVIDKATDLIIQEKDRKVVVVSAMGGVTDRLVSMAKKVVDLPNALVEEECNRFHRDFLEFHRSAAEAVIRDGRVLGEVIARIAELSEELRVTLLGLGYLGDLSLKPLDYILSFGERLSVLIVAGALESKGVKAKALTGYEAGIITDSNFGCARPVYSKMKDSVKAALLPLLKAGVLPVVTGFVAADKNARITTMGRGGSDYSASLIGRFLGVDEVQIWTDVDGILSTDPKIVSSVQLIPKLSYIEAVDLAYFGAKVIHSKMIEPAMEADIPVRIKNTFNPKADGTLIVREQERIERIIKAVAIAKNIDIVNVRGMGMSETPNIAGRLFSLLGENNINIPMISGSSESNLSFVLKRGDVSRAVELLNESFVGNGVRSIEVLEDVCIITVVGVGMTGTKGIAARIFQTVADNDVNIIMIAQGSSEVNVSFVVNAEDGNKAVRALHKRFIEDEIRSG
ncbi:MAG: aspartate kinase [Candidatus Altiarchaeota archaeon]|nr:aspartate kinase [Candidatus Altiarchaeota archaeon]